MSDRLNCSRAEKFLPTASKLRSFCNGFSNRFYKIFLLTLALHFLASANTVNCSPPAANEKNLYSEEYKRTMSADEIQDSYKRVYISGKRLKYRAYFDDSLKSYVLPVEVGDQFKPTVVPISFFKNVSNHIEKALERNYAEAVIFPDMGHSHFFIPDQTWNDDLSKISSSESDIFYQRLLSIPTLKVLYHIAEKLKMVDEKMMPLQDKYLQQRYYTRNILGSNDGSLGLDILFDEDKNKFNTVHELKGYRYMKGFNISASKDGCFSYNHEGKIYYYDLSLEDLEPQEATYDD